MLQRDARGARFVHSCKTVDQEICDAPGRNAIDLA